MSLLDPNIILFLKNLLRKFECYKNGRIWLQALLHPVLFWTLAIRKHFVYLRDETLSLQKQYYEQDV